MPSASRNRNVDADQFSLRFRLLMGYHDLTLRDIAEQTQTAISTVGTWKNGRVPSTEKSLGLLAQLFGVSVDFLLYGVSLSGNVPPRADAPCILGEIESLIDEIAKPETPLPQSVPDASSVPYRRDCIERYLKTFLDRAETEPGGLAHTWYHIRREFPLDFFKRHE
ncbi:MAG: helix-turn-helix transcriptional regulator [Verrucomicrobiota bacterium]